MDTGVLTICQFCLRIWHVAGTWDGIDILKGGFEHTARTVAIR